MAEVKEGKWVPRVSPLLRRAVPAQDSPWQFGDRADLLPALPPSILAG